MTEEQRSASKRLEKARGAEPDMESQVFMSLISGIESRKR